MLKITRGFDAGQDRAFICRAVTMAATRKVLERRTHRLKRLNFSLDLREARLCDLAYFPAITILVDAQSKQVANLCKSETELLRTLDKANARNRTVWVEPKARVKSGRCRKQSLTLVVTQGLWIHPTVEGEFTGVQRHAVSLLLLTWCWMRTEKRSTCRGAGRNGQRDPYVGDAVLISVTRIADKSHSESEAKPRWLRSRSSVSTAFSLDPQ